MPLNENFLQELKYKTDIEDIISTYEFISHCKLWAYALFQAF